MKRDFKRWTGIFLSLVVSLNCGIHVNAAEIKIPKTEETQQNIEEEQKELTPEQMKEQELQAAYDMKIETNEIQNWPEGPQIYGESGIVMDMQSGAILYGKEIDERHYPASITKVLTALVAMEHSSLTDIVTFSQESVLGLEKGYSHIGMRQGEQITMKDALHALMLASANEVAYAIGETVGGTYEHFLEMMNEKARELGCTGTHFVNVNGVFSEDHYTTARDMALISRAAFSHQELLDIVQTKEYTIPPTNLETESRTFQQKHKMMVADKEFDARCIGGKTGYTEEAFNTLVTIMESDGRKIVAVIMKSRKDTYPDTKKICDYAFENFEEVNISENEKSKQISGIAPEACVTLPKNVSFRELKWKADDNGNLNYTYKGQLVGTTKAVVKKELKVPKKEEKTKEKAAKTFPVGRIILVVLAILGIAGLIALSVFVGKKNKIIKEQRRRRRERHARRRRDQDQNHLFD